LPNTYVKVIFDDDLHILEMKYTWGGDMSLDFFCVEWIWVVPAEAQDQDYSFFGLRLLQNWTTT
jgi:hypothetical protein